MRGNKLDTIKAWVIAHKVLLIQIGAVISIAVVVAAIMIHDIAPSKAAFTDEVKRLDTGITTVGSTVGSLGTKVVSVEGSVKDAQEGLSAATDAMAALETRMDIAKGHIDTLGTEIAAVKSTVHNPTEAWLTGTTGNYTLHARAGKAGNYTSTIHLCYAAPVSWDEFFGTMDWDDEDLRDYMPSISVNPSVSGNTTPLAITKVSFSVGIFNLEAGVEKTIAVLFGGIHADYAPDWAYAEIWPALKE